MCLFLIAQRLRLDFLETLPDPILLQTDNLQTVPQPTEGLVRKGRGRPPLSPQELDQWRTDAARGTPHLWIHQLPVIFGGPPSLKARRLGFI